MFVRKHRRENRDMQDKVIAYERQETKGFESNMGGTLARGRRERAGV